MKTLKTLVYLSVALILSALFSGCQTIDYYSQALGGHSAIWWNQRNIDAVLLDPSVDEKIKVQLRELQQVREFASAELMLPRNDSYSRYVDTGRNYVVWNVVATPRYSVDAVKSCFPIVGCVSYRGYYAKEAAIEQAGKLKVQGLDVYVGGVGAYSTLGWFDDPVLNTMLSRSRIDTISLIFHELSHQQVFIKDDTRFNESFATAVAELGLNQWALSKGETRLLTEYRLEKSRRAEVVKLILTAREAMRQAYEEAATGDKLMLETIKFTQFQKLTTDYQRLKASGGGTRGFDHFFDSDLNHASLALFGEYHGWVIAFKQLFIQKQQNWVDFYQAVKTLSLMPEQERSVQLQALQGSV